MAILRPITQYEATAPLIFPNPQFQLFKNKVFVKQDLQDPGIYKYYYCTTSVVLVGLKIDDIISLIFLLFMLKTTFKTYFVKNKNEIFFGLY